MKTGVLALASLPIVLALPVPAGAEFRVGVVIGAPAYRPAYAASDSFHYAYEHPDTSRYGYDRGYREGSDNGFKDARKHRRYDVARDGDYRDADAGYKHWMGPRGAYANGFRQGYEAGYSRGYREACESRDYRDR
jgi:hypothetical protein